MDMKMKIITFLVIALILVNVPIAGKYFQIINTLIHEVGHQFAAIMTFGKPAEISLFSNTEGVAYSSHRFWFGKVITSLAGYVFSSFLAFFFFFLIFKGKSQYVIYILLAILAISMVFWVRNLYGVFWMLTFSAGFIWIVWKANESIVESLVLFLVSIIFIASISSAFDIMSISFKTPENSGDASNLAKFTFIIPAQIWGTFFFLQSLFFGWMSMKLFFPILRRL